MVIGGKTGGAPQTQSRSLFLLFVGILCFLFPIGYEILLFDVYANVLKHFLWFVLIFSVIFSLGYLFLPKGSKDRKDWRKTIPRLLFLSLVFAPIGITLLLVASAFLFSFLPILGCVVIITIAVSKMRYTDELNRVHLKRFGPALLMEGVSFLWFPNIIAMIIIFLVSFCFWFRERISKGDVHFRKQILGLGLIVGLTIAPFITDYGIIRPFNYTYVAQSTIDVDNAAQITSAVEDFNFSNLESEYFDHVSDAETLCEMYDHYYAWYERLVGIPFLFNSYYYFHFRSTTTDEILASGSKITYWKDFSIMEPQAGWEISNSGGQELLNSTQVGGRDYFYLFMNGSQFPLPTESPQEVILNATYFLVTINLSFDHSCGSLCGYWWEKTAWVILNSSYHVGGCLLQDGGLMMS